MQLPLASWGSGTRRFAALAIAEQNQGEAPITLVDEVERGLEPYRQRFLMEDLQAGESQVFVTTHSPSAISAASKASLWYVDHAGGIGQLTSAAVARQRKTDPETFLASVRRCLGRAAFERRDLRTMHLILATVERLIRERQQGGEPVSEINTKGSKARRTQARNDP